MGGKEGGIEGAFDPDQGATEHHKTHRGCVIVVVVGATCGKCGTVGYLATHSALLV